jgi:hypothetical protein
MTTAALDLPARLTARIAKVSVTASSGRNLQGQVRVDVDDGDHSEETGRCALVHHGGVEPVEVVGCEHPVADELV